MHLKLLDSLLSHLRERLNTEHVLLWSSLRPDTAGATYAPWFPCRTLLNASQLLPAVEAEGHDVPDFSHSSGSPRLAEVAMSHPLNYLDPIASGIQPKHRCRVAICYIVAGTLN